MRYFRAAFLFLLLVFPSGPARAADEAQIILPSPSVSGTTSVEQALAERRSIRQLRPDPIALEHLSQLLWAAQGVTDPRGFRSAPSAGALFPLTVYAAVGAVVSLDTGLHRYVPQGHRLIAVGDTDIRRSLVAAAFGQAWMSAAPVILVITGREATTRRKYGDRAPAFIAIEAGHAAQNVYLQAHALGLGTTSVGGFNETKAHRALDLSDGENVLLLMPVGAPVN